MDDNLQTASSDQNDGSQNDASINPVSDQASQPVVSEDAHTSDNVPTVEFSAPDASDNNVSTEQNPLGDSVGEDSTDSVEEVKTFTETVDDVEEDTKSYMDDTATA